MTMERPVSAASDTGVADESQVDNSSDIPRQRKKTKASSSFLRFKSSRSQDFGIDIASSRCGPVHVAENVVNMVQKADRGPRRVARWTK